MELIAWWRTGQKSGISAVRREVKNAGEADRRGSGMASWSKWCLHWNPSDEEGQGEKRAQMEGKEHTCEGPRGESDMVCLSIRILLIAGNKAQSGFNNKENIMSFLRTRSLGVSILGLVNSVSQTCLQILSSHSAILCVFADFVSLASLYGLKMVPRWCHMQIAIGSFWREKNFPEAWVFPLGLIGRNGINAIFKTSY